MICTRVHCDRCGTDTKVLFDTCTLISAVVACPMCGKNIDLSMLKFILKGRVESLMYEEIFKHKPVRS